MAGAEGGRVGERALLLGSSAIALPRFRPFCSSGGGGTRMVARRQANRPSEQRGRRGQEDLEGEEAKGGAGARAFFVLPGARGAPSAFGGGGVYCVPAFPTMVVG